MGRGDSTCWSLIRGARAGELTQRDVFVRRYAPLVEAFLEARWRRGALRSRVGDAVDEVFLQCFKEEGVLDHYEEGRGGGFRAYFFGVVRNVARTIESRQARRPEQLIESEIPGAGGENGEETPSQAFDRAWGRAVLHEAGELFSERARADDDGGPRRVELLRLHVLEGVSIREIGRRWETDRQALQRQFARARKEFERAVWDVLRDQLGDDPVAVDREWKSLESLIP